VRPTSCSASLKVEKYCFAAFKGPVSQIANPKRSYDKAGCLPDEEVRDMCNGVHDVLSGPQMEGKQCCYSVCRGPLPPCGRALVADDTSNRTATRVARGDWAGSPITPLPTSPALAARLAHAWTEDALLEHASIASFARFSLELLLVGAPPELVEDAQRAGGDEIAHARVCFAIATAYGGERVGPGALSLDGVAPRTTLAAIAAAAAAEACVGETYSAFAALVARDNCTDPAIRAVLDRIAEDETRHAELGFRFVAWALRTGDASVHAAVHASFASALAAPAQSAPTSPDEEWRAAGRLDEALRAEAFAEAARTVIAPALEELRISSPWPQLPSRARL